MPFTDSTKMVDVIMSNSDLLSANPIDVVQGKGFIGSTKKMVYGTMPVDSIHGDITLLAGESYNVPFGKVPVSYNVIAEALSTQTSATAINTDILDGKTAWVNGVKLTGVMTNVGKEDATLLAGESHTITKGYHNGTGVITARSLADQTFGNATTNDILIGKNAWVNGSQVVGSMTNNGKEDDTLNAGESHTISKGYHNGTGIIKAASLSSQTPANATVDDIIAGKTAWVNGHKITGNIVNIPPSTTVLPINGTYTIPKGNHSGNGIVTQNIPTYEGQTVASVSEPQILNTSGCYMTGNITVAGITALNFQRSNSAVKDSNNNDISHRVLTVTNNKAQVVLSVDNWHDNATLNIYRITFDSCVDINGNNVNLDVEIMIDWTNQTKKILKFGTVEISIELQSNTYAHLFTISNIISATITIINPFMARTFGDSHDI